MTEPATHESSLSSLGLFGKKKRQERPEEKEEGRNKSSGGKKTFGNFFFARHFKNRLFYYFKEFSTSKLGAKQAVLKYLKIVNVYDVAVKPSNYPTKLCLLAYSRFVLCFQGL